MARKFGVVVCIVLWLTMAFPAAAAPSRDISAVVRIDIANPVLVACNYSPGLIQGHLSVVAYNASNGIENPSGTPLPFTLTFSSGGQNESFNVSLSSDEVLPYGISFGNQLLSSVTITVSGGSASSSITYTCDTGTSSTQPDSRLNLGAGDLINALYNTTDSAGQPTISVWEVQPDSSGSYIDSFDYSIFAPYFESAPTVNTLLDTINKTSLYALTTGEFQLVVGPDAEGKHYTTVFSGLPALHVYYPIP